MALCEEWDLERVQCHCLISGGLPSICATSSYLTHLLHVIGTIPGAAVGFAHLWSSCWPFKRWKPCTFFHYPNSHWFLQPQIIGVYLPGARILGCVVWPGAGLNHSQGIPPSFYPPHVNVGIPIPLPPTLHTIPCPLYPGCMIPPVLPVWMNAASLNLCLSDFYTAWFPDDSGCYFFLRSGGNSFYGWMSRRSVSTYASNMRGSWPSHLLKVQARLPVKMAK